MRAAVSAGGLRRRPPSQTAGSVELGNEGTKRKSARAEASISKSEGDFPVVGGRFEGWGARLKWAGEGLGGLW